MLPARYLGDNRAGGGTAPAKFAIAAGTIGAAGAVSAGAAAALPANAGAAGIVFHRITSLK